MPSTGTTQGHLTTGYIPHQPDPAQQGAPLPHAQTPAILHRRVRAAVVHTLHLCAQKVVVPILLQLVQAEAEVTLLLPDQGEVGARLHQAAVAAVVVVEDAGKL